METKILISEFNLLNAKEAKEEYEKKINELNKQGWTTKASNLTTINNIKYTIYVLMERNLNNEQ